MNLQKYRDHSVAPDGEAYEIPEAFELQASLNQLAERIEEQRSLGREIIAVQGLGFVGAAVAAVIADARDSSGNPVFSVIGVDTPPGYWKVARILEGTPPVTSPDPELERITRTAVRETKNLFACISPEAFSFADVIVVDVGLDVQDRSVACPNEIELELESFEAALADVGRFMRSDALVLIETTVPIGTCKTIAAPILEQERSRRGIADPLLLAHCYERVMPGANYVDSIRKIWRTIAGIDRDSLKRARDFLSSFTDVTNYSLSEMDDIAASEMAKLLENSYRAVNIAFIHEWTLLAERLGVDLFKVVESIRVRKGTHDNMRYPGFGVGGYCLTKDPLLAQWSTGGDERENLVLRMTLEGLKVNYEMPLHTLGLLKEAAGDNLEGKNIAICGVAYLPGVADTRNSPAEIFVDNLLDQGCSVTAHDPCVLTWHERPHVPLFQDLSQALDHAQGIVLSVPHSCYQGLAVEDLLMSKTARPCIVDAQNIISDELAQNLRSAGCKVIGVGKGHWRKMGYHV
jgi:UDP-N-acetyl-D-glucosamine dehydrogenase